MDGIKRDQSLKLVGAVLMAIDHIGAVLFPEQIFLRIIGRLSFPVFAYDCAKGAHLSKNPARYALRLAVFAVVSQLPYYLCFGHGKLNILFTLLYGLVCCVLWGEGGTVRIFSAALLFAGFWMPFLDYGAYGIISIFLFYVFYNKRLYASILFAAATLAYSYSAGVYIQCFAVFSLFLIYPGISFGLKVPKYFFYFFYPAHLMLLWAVRLAL